MAKYPHHKAWLAAHPHRSEEWFDAKIGDGFDVHHIDHDRQNHDPSNLVLIEGSDHMLLHGVRKILTSRNSGRMGAKAWLAKSTRAERAARASKAAQARWAPWAKFGITRVAWRRRQERAARGERP